MDADLRARAETRLTEAAARLHLADPRPPYRERLKLLRDAHPDAFGRAVEHYEQRVLPALAAEDPLPAWLRYGAFLGGLTSNGELTAVDTTGRATPATDAGEGVLVLFVPADSAEPVLIALQPLLPAPAQQATLDLLVNRRLTLQ